MAAKVLPVVGLSVRAAPDSQAAKIGVLPFGSEIEVVRLEPTDAGTWAVLDLSAGGVRLTQSMDTGTPGLPVEVFVAAQFLELSGDEAFNRMVEDPGITFSGDSGESWTEKDRLAVLTGVRQIGNRMVPFVPATSGDAPGVARWAQAFRTVFGNVTFHRLAGNCPSCIAETGVREANTIDFFHSGAGLGDTNDRIKPNLVCHELGHLFSQRRGLRPYTDLKNEWAAQPGFPHRDETNREARGYAGLAFVWQQSRSLTQNEEFADMFLGWSFDKWEVDDQGALTTAGRIRSEWIGGHMAGWV